MTRSAPRRFAATAFYLPPDASQVTKELVQLGVSEKTAGTIIKTMSARSVEELSTIAEVSVLHSRHAPSCDAGAMQGADQEGLDELKELFVQVMGRMSLQG